MKAPIARCLTAALVSVAIPATALATPEVGGHDNGWSIADETYLRTYEKCWEAFKEDCGANLLDYAWKGGEAPSEAQVERSTATMERWLNPPEPPVVSSTSSAVVTAPATSTVAPASSTVMCESGGDYAANTGNGYYGGYQFDSGTWDAYGDSAYGEANEAPPAVQDAAAAKVPYDAWPNC